MTELFKVPMRAAVVAALIVLLLPFAAPVEADAADYTLALQTVAPDRTPWARQLKRLKKRWEKDSGGRLKVKLFLGRGNEIALARKCKSGELQGVAVSTAAMVEEVPEMGVFELPYLFKDVQAADRIIDGFLFDETAKLLADNGFILYMFSENGYRNFGVKGKEIHTTADLAALKMRTQENWIHEETYRALGGNPVRISAAEVLTSLSTGQVDGFDNTPLFAFATSWYSEIDTWTVSDHIYQPAVVIFNKRWFDSLPDDIQKTLLDQREEETKKGRRAIRGLTPKLLTAMAKKGIKVVQMTDAEKAKFRQETRSVHKMFRKKVGKRGAHMLDVIDHNQ